MITLQYLVLLGKDGSDDHEVAHHREHRQGRHDGNLQDFTWDFLMCTINGSPAMSWQHSPNENPVSVFNTIFGTLFVLFVNFESMFAWNC